MERQRDGEAERQRDRKAVSTPERPRPYLEGLDRDVHFLFTGHLPLPHAHGLRRHKALEMTVSARATLGQHG